MNAFFEAFEKPMQTYVLTFEPGKELIFRNVHNYTKSKSVNKKISSCFFYPEEEIYT